MAGVKRKWLSEQEQRRRAASLGELRAAGIAVFAWCNRCGHNAVLDSERLVAELGEDFAVPEVGARLRCTDCGGNTKGP